jgi:DNA-binding LacI/PurR family transcriptional regulator
MMIVLQNRRDADADFVSSKIRAAGEIICLKKTKSKSTIDLDHLNKVNKLFGEFNNSPLNTTRQYGVDLKRTANKTLVSLSNKPQQASIQSIVITLKLIIRKSTLKNY